MIIKTEKEEIVNNLKREQRQYTIASSPKAFSVLMDKLYSDKITSIVRELTSNAYDAHVEAGRLSIPFEVTCPTALAPTFAVRDYGESMEHDFVMVLYSSIFYSSKEDTNDQVGTFGLGSKSPFAYADGFNLACFRDGTVNLYSAFYDEDRVPSITHIATKETSERNGTYVSFQCSAKDVAEFEKAIQFTHRCYWRYPFKLINTTAPPSVVTSKLLEIDWVHVVPTNTSGYWQRKRWFSQGNVWYPVPDRFLSNYNSRQAGRVAGDETINYAPSLDLVIEVPIGTFNITPSREAISLDKYSVESINAYLKMTRETIESRVKGIYDPCKTRLDYYNVYYDLSNSAAANFAETDIPNPLKLTMRSSTIKLHPDHIKYDYSHPLDSNTLYGEFKLADAPVGNLYSQPKANTFVTQQSMNFPKVMKLYVGLERKLVRKAYRIKSVNTDKTYYCHTRDLPRFVRILGLRQDQIFSIDQIPDPGPSPRPPANKDPIVQPTYTGNQVFIVITANSDISAKDPFIKNEQKHTYGKVNIDDDFIRYFFQYITSSYQGIDNDIYEKLRLIRIEKLYFEKYAGDNTRHLWPVLLEIVGGEDELVKHMANAGLTAVNLRSLEYENTAVAGDHPIFGMYNFITSERIKGRFRINQGIASAWSKWPFKLLEDRIGKEIEATSEEYKKTLEDVKVEYPIFKAKTPDELRTHLEVLKCTKTSNT